MNDLAAMLSALALRAERLLASELETQQRTFVQHIGATARQLLSMVEPIPPGDAALWQIIPALGERFSKPQEALYGYAHMLIRQPEQFGGAGLDAVQDDLLREIHALALAILRETESLHERAFALRTALRQQPAAPLDLPPFLEEEAAIWRYWLRERPISLQLDLKPDLPPVQAHAYHLGEVLRHLVLTIAQEWIETGQITLSAERDGARIRLAIAAPGMRGSSAEWRDLFAKDGRDIYARQLSRMDVTAMFQRWPNGETRLALILPVVTT